MTIITDKKILEKIENALTEIRPFLEADGGDISLVEVTKDMVVKVKLMGACSDCNVKKTTLNNGVEIVVKRAVPEVKKVIDVSNL
jgi:Fe-S cluster biogenesis protein NfuA|tara:strand:- start:669 stop:923 length:255 start_codon:yes stop_codon:yes gene_type:complete